MSANAGSRNSSNQSLTKLALAARVLGKELRRLKLKRMDLRRADFRLGEKAYAFGAIEGQAELVSRLDGVTKRVMQLRQQEIAPESTFAGKAKAVGSKVAEAVRIGALQSKRRRVLRQLGANLRQSEANSSLPEETQAARAVADRVSAVETDISQLAPHTYFWARRPLLLVCLLLLLAAIGGAFALRHKLTPTLTQRRGGPGRSSLSEPQMKSILAQQQTFQQQLLEMQAEGHRREAEQTQARIAAAEQAQKQQWEREQAEQKKRLAEQAAADRARQAQEAERQKAAEEKEEEEARTAAAQEQQESMKREEAARTERAERERSAAETKRQEQERARAEREQAEREAQARQRIDDEKKQQADRIAAEAKQKKHAEFEKLKAEEEKKVAAVQEQYRQEILTLARVKVIYQFPAEFYPMGELSADESGNFYGIADAHRKKKLFKLTPKGEFTTTSTFDDPGFSGGQNAKVVQGKDGSFYAATQGGNGTICKITAEGQLSVIHKFTDKEGQGLKALTWGKNGNLYGVARNGGAAKGGTIFKVTPAGNVTVLHNFMVSSDEGYYPEGQLIQTRDGNFYGTTSMGGTHGGDMHMTAQGLRHGETERFGTFNTGTIFRITPTGEFTVLHQLNEGPWTRRDAPEGAHARDPLVESDDGNFYGTTSEAGKHGRGTIFKMTPHGELTVLYDFGDEGQPAAGLSQGPDGNFYIITSGVYGSSHRGAILKLGPAGNVKPLVVFKDAAGTGNTTWFGFPDPKQPVSSLHVGRDGKLYGVTRKGGTNLTGTFFQVDSSDTFVASEEEKSKADKEARVRAPGPRIIVEEGEVSAERALADAALDQPGIDPRIAKFFRPLFHAAADADHSHRADSERVVRESGGAKLLCPKCNGYKFIARHEYDSTSINPYAWNDPRHDTYEHNRQQRLTVRCDECNGAGVVDAR